jgi:hypothetical protein
MGFHDNRLQEIAEINFVAHPYEKIRGNLTFLNNYRPFSSHNFDLLLLFIVYFIVFSAAAVAALVAFHQKRVLAEQLIFGAAFFGGLTTIAAKLIENSQKRLATVDLFTSEILSIGRVFISSNIVGMFVHLFDELSKPNLVLEASSNGGLDAPLQIGPFGFADAARKESYFTIFEKNSTDLGPLSADIISDVTAFYTFLKASRDATGAMSLWKEPYYVNSMQRNDVISVLYNCFLMAIHGRLALNGLIEQDQRAKYASEVFNSIEVKCYCFLITVLQRFDQRYRILYERRDYYLGVAKCYANEGKLQGADFAEKMIAAMHSASAPARCDGPPL